MLTYKNGLIWAKADILEKIKELKYKNFKDQIVLYPSDIVFKKPQLIGEIKGLMFLPEPNVKKSPDLRRYQSEIYERWAEKKKGVIVMPTGAGKTLVGIKAVCDIHKPALCVVPTLSLVDQWLEKFKDFSDDIGEWTGRRKALAPITVSTYDSASISADFLGNKFEILIFDEVHHLPSENYRRIALFSIAQYRMGLTATLEREDNLHELIKDLVGDTYELSYKDVEDFLADWEIKQIKVRISRENYSKYRELMSKYISFCIKQGLDPREKTSFLRVINMSAHSQEAREALLSHRLAKDISKNSGEKLEVVGQLIQKHQNDKIIIFTDSQSMAYRISETFLIPCITSDIPQEERQKYMVGFSSGVYHAIVSAHVLDEGIDVPDASCAIVVSGSSSSREFIQRLGRILRPSKPKAVLYEIISAGTSEKFSSERRKNKLEDFD